WQQGGVDDDKEGGGGSGVKWRVGGSGLVGRIDRRVGNLFGLGRKRSPENFSGGGVVAGVPNAPYGGCCPPKQTPLFAADPNPNAPSWCGDVGKAAVAMLMVGVVFDGGSGVDGDGAWGRVVWGIE
nr:hypothetical protein [Tanacetum cinerariifolium]